MKTLLECKEYFKDVYTNCLIYQDNDTYKALENLQETLDFIYPEFKNIVSTWINDAYIEHCKNSKAV